MASLHADFPAQLALSVQFYVRNVYSAMARRKVAEGNWWENENEMGNQLIS
jgi:hypothetical protein